MSCRSLTRLLLCVSTAIGASSHAAAMVHGGPRDGAEDRVLVLGHEDGIAAAWEYVSGRPALERRATLQPSGWTPSLLLGEESPELWRLQVPRDRGSGYTVTLYRWDPASWSVTELLSSDQIHGLGRAGERVYLSTDAGVRILDLDTGQVESPPRAFRRLRDLQSHWLVELSGDRGASIALFDPSLLDEFRELEVPEFLTAENGASGVPWMALDPSSRYLGVLEPLPVARWPSFGTRTAERTTLHLVDTESGECLELPIRLLVAGGSGRPVIYHSLDLGFDGHGLHYLDILPATDGQEPEPVERRTATSIFGEAQEPAPPLDELARAGQLVRVHVALRTGDISRTQVGPADLEQERTAARFVPPFLASEEREFRNVLDLPAAFLEHHGVPQGFRTETDGRVGYYHCPLAFDESGRRFLGEFPLVGARRALYYADLESDLLLEVDGRGVHQPRFHWVQAAEEGSRGVK